MKSKIVLCTVILSSLIFMLLNVNVFQSEKTSPFYEIAGSGGGIWMTEAYFTVDCGPISFYVDKYYDEFDQLVAVIEYENISGAQTYSGMYAYVIHYEGSQGPSQQTGWNCIPESWNCCTPCPVPCAGC
jgi:hypothetical protein